MHTIKNTAAAIASALTWISFFALIGFFVWIQHVQYMEGHETMLFGHLTPQEKRIREAKVLEHEAKAKLAQQEAERAR